MNKEKKLNESKNSNENEEMLKEFYELFDSELISFYEFNPEEETFSEACEKIDKGQKRKLN